MARRKPRADAADAPTAEDGFVALQAPEDVNSVSHDGVEYEVEEGFVTVPVVAVADLLNHGFTK